MKPTFIDVRDPAQYANSHVDGSINIPLAKIQDDSSATADLPKDGEYIVYCNMGGSSSRAETALKSKGFTNVTNGINQATIEASS